MKIFIEYDPQNLSGKGKFLGRLVKQWEKMGIKYSDKQEGCDARLSLTRFRTKSKLPTVIRIDGSHNEINPIGARDKKRLLNSLKWKNKKTADSINKSKAVIWQSDFSRKMGHSFLKIKPKNEYVIFNGDDPNNYLERKPENIVVMSANWKNRKHKRLKEMLEIAGNVKELSFHVLGPFDGNYNIPDNVVTHGLVDQNKIREILSKSLLMLNICYSDWCPNAVVEALVAGVPVICTANHGVSEIVKNSGIVVDIDEPISKKHFMRAINKPIKNIQPVYDAIKEIMNGKTFEKPCHLYIDKIAEKYANVFRQILKK